MFGYIRIFPEQLRLCDATDYRRVYCGLCHQIANYSQFGRMFLSFDLVFFSILSSYENKQLAAQCTLKHCYCKTSCQDKNMDYWAAMSVLMIYHKLLNDFNDGSHIKKLYIWNLESAYTKAKKQYAHSENLIRTALSKINELEKEKKSTPESFMCIFGSLGSELISASPEPPQDKSLLDLICRIAYILCEWIYCMDFYDDLEKDKKKGHYNPLLIKASNENRDLDEIKADFRKCIDLRVAELQKLCAFLPYGGFHEIVVNVLHEGVVSVTSDVYNGCFIPKKYG